MMVKISSPPLMCLGTGQQVTKYVPADAMQEYAKICNVAVVVSIHLAIARSTNNVPTMERYRKPKRSSQFFKTTESSYFSIATGK